ncbi:MAG: PBP1A family penicillin-binding protein [Desulfobacterales bacterium]|nr:PBP1A family penicillin-binding protein [Desulfobacterales bacterium]MDD4072275.1 PBP1A family penicillin-binding protein [Desulfobacterales bacterium]MDD4392812.1 PBP1A family penicillin-binding protein [Desulfobacterales bacterium]
MKKKSSKKLRLKPILKLFSALLFFVTVGLAVYSLYLSSQIENRFAGQRWQIPSKVYSDTTILYPGQRIHKDFFLEKLKNLGYRNVGHSPKRMGELNPSPSAVELYLHDFTSHSGTRKGFPVRIEFYRDSITSIVRRDNFTPVPILELEPEEIALFFGPDRERRQLVSIQHVPRHLIHAIMAAEDTRFYSHHGIDPVGILRAIYTNLRHGSIRQGGSTITQQLAKNYFLTPERTLSRKLKEALISLIMETMYEKDDILEIYLNEIYLGQNGPDSINGIGEASFFYFGKPVSELSLSESAVMAGLIKGPNRYSPYVNQKRSRERRNQVLQSMLKNGWINEKQLKNSLDAPLRTAGANVHQRKAPYFIDYLSEQLTTLYSGEDLASMGLSIYTTLDTQVQRAAETALKNGLARLEKSIPSLKRKSPEKKLQGAVIVIQPKTGYILAMAGGRDYAKSQFNRITMARRQPGSAFKPFVYLAGLDQFTPASILSNIPKSYSVNGKQWSPENFDPVSEPEVSMRTALKNSYNLATVDLAMKVGLKKIITTARSFHISTPLKPYPSLALGAFEVIPIELAGAFCTFAADGFQPYLLSLKNAADESGRVLNRRHMNIEQLISPAKAFIMNSMLRSVVEDGTARSLKNLGISFPVSGKTGTTNQYKDAWFVGYTPDILALVWVGFDNGDSIHATGSTAALPIWAELMRAIPQYVSGDCFAMPQGVVRKTICSESGKLAVSHACRNTTEEFFLEENVPQEQCPLHQPNIFYKFFNKG